MEKFCIIITKENSGERVDIFLKEYFNYGTRAVRRILKEYEVLLNGKQAKASAVLSTDDVITCSFPKEEGSEEKVEIIDQNDDFFIVYKNANIHTAEIAGKQHSSLEKNIKAQHAYYSLCTRLDFETSGIILVAKTKGAYQYFKGLERAQKIKKEYYALVQGNVEEQSIKNTINMENRSKSIVEEIYSQDPSRYTHCKPVDKTLFLEGLSTPLTLLLCTIYRGARHQIRSHLAYIGNPIVGDTLYGDANSAYPLFLHNASIAIENITFSAPVPDFWKPITNKYSVL